MRDVEGIPTALKVVAALFFLGAVLGTIEILIAFSNNRFSFNTSVLGFFIGPGLLARHPGWRTCALVLLWISMIMLPLFVPLLIFFPRPIDFDLFGIELGHIPKPLAVTFTIGLFALAYWQYRVLTRPDIRRLFGLTS